MESMDIFGELNFQSVITNFGGQTVLRVPIRDSIMEKTEQKVHTRHRRVHIESNKNRFAQFFTSHKWNFALCARSNVTARIRSISSIFATTD